jgi:two-component system cell cycle response regulator DivK
MAASDQLASIMQKPILVVEDDERCHRLLNDVLAIEGYRVLGTRLGAEAVHLAREHHPDLIILDIRLPDISGFEVVRQLKADEMTRMIPIIAATAVAMREDERKILNGGCDFYVAKPFIPSQFVKTVARVLDRDGMVVERCDTAAPIDRPGCELGVQLD